MPAVTTTVAGQAPRRPDLDDDALLCPKQAADFLDLSVRTLECWRRCGEGPAYYQYTRAVRYQVADLRAYLDEHRRSPRRTTTCQRRSR